MDNLLTLLGEARAYVNIYSAGCPHPGSATARAYDQAYQRCLSAIHDDDAAAATERWRRAAIRHGALRRLRKAVEPLADAVTCGDRTAAELAAASVRAALTILYRYPAGVPGRGHRAGQVPAI